MMFEKQCKSSSDTLKASSSNLDDAATQPLDAMQVCAEKSDLESSKVDLVNTETDPAKANAKSEQGSQELEGKQKAPETEDPPENPELDVCVSSSQPPKGPKIKE